MEMPTLSDLNWLAIIAAVVVNMIIGALWYSKLLFANQWMALIGKTEKELQNGATTGYIIATVVGFVEAIFLSFLITNMVASTVVEGAIVGIMVWVGFIAPATLVTTVFSNIRKKLWAINYGYHVVALAFMGAIIAAWPK